MDEVERRHDTDITELLADLKGTDHETALARLLPLVYDELRALSEAYLRQEREDHTLQATALVHEAYVRLVEGQTVQWSDRAHFFRVAARTMRRILVGHARAHGARKRGSGRPHVGLEEATVALPEREVDLLDLDETLRRLARVDEQKARIVELRFFAGCTINQTAETLGISTASVERDWRFARAWLYRELEDLGPENDRSFGS